MSSQGDGRGVVLASASTRRRDLLASVGIAPALITAPNIDETIRAGESGRRYVVRMAREKAEKVADGRSFVLAADTIALRGRRILDRPLDASQASAFLELLSGRRHTIISAVCLIAPDGAIRQRRVETAVQFKRLNRREITAFVATEEWRNKAGGYAAQGAAGAFIRRVNGSWSNVLGLPLYETLALLRGVGALRP